MNHCVLIRRQQQQLQVSYVKLAMIGSEAYLVWQDGALNFSLIGFLPRTGYWELQLMLDTALSVQVQIARLDTQTSLICLILTFLTTAKQRFIGLFQLVSEELLFTVSLVAVSVSACWAAVAGVLHSTFTASYHQLTVPALPTAAHTTGSSN